MEPRLRAIPEQFFVLVDYMERNGDLSKPQPGLQGRIKSDRLWQELASSLNSVGGGVQKSTDKWKKVWADYKTKTKKKYLTIRSEAGIPGGSRHFLTNLEEKVVDIMGVSAAVKRARQQEQEHSTQFNVTVSVDTNSSSEEPCPDVKDSAVEYLLLEADQHNEGDLIILSSPPARNIASSTSTHPNQSPTYQNQFPTHPKQSPTHPDQSRPNLDQSPKHENQSPTHQNQFPTHPDQSPTQPFESPSRSSPSPTYSYQSPTYPSSPPPSRIPPARRSRTQASPSPASPSPASMAKKSRSSLKARRNRGLTPFDRAASEFVAIEKLRLEFEERRDKRLHELELRRLEVDCFKNKLLSRLSDIGQKLVDTLSQRSNRR